ncbi:MAG: RsmD family RNA methyltransferase, partial [Patescibacteria group bacterium]
FSFFQINVPMFEQALADISTFTTDADILLDYYAGVGSIGLPLARTAKSCMLVEQNEDAARFAEKNIAENNISNTTAFCSVAERMTDYITGDATLIVDPPRAGLHEKLIQRILSEKPQKIIYLSCNLATHARDIGLLREAYTITSLKLYNFFPRTPHIEALCVLERK